MALTVTVTPQETWPDGTEITLARLRKSAKPTVSVDGSIAGSDIAANSITRSKIKHEDFSYAGEASPGADAISITLSPLPASLVNGLQVVFKTASAKGANPTLDVGVGGAKKLLKATGVALVANELAANQIVVAVYNTSLDSGNGAWEIISQIALVNDQYAADTGAADAYAVALAPSPVSYYAGLTVRFKATNANTGASTLDVNTLGTKAIKRHGGSALQAGDILASQIVEVVYDGTNFQLLSPPVNPSTHYAVDAAGSDAYAITLDPAPTAYYAGLTVRFKAGTANTGACTLNVNALGAKAIKKLGNTDPNDGEIRAGQIVEVVYDGTNFQLIGEARKEFSVGSLAIPAQGAAVTAQNHGLGTNPGHVHWVLVCGTTDLGYVVGDEVPVECVSDDNFRQALFPWASSTQVGLVRTDAAGLKIANKGTGSQASNIDTAKWTLKAYAKL